jgi:Tfp pilus assembly protein PilN
MISEKVIQKLFEGSILFVALYFLWGAFSKQIDRQNHRIDTLESKIELCNGEQRKILTERLDVNSEMLRKNTETLLEFKEKRRYD